MLLRYLFVNGHIIATELYTVHCVIFSDPFYDPALVLMKLWKWKENVEHIKTEPDNLALTGTPN